MTETAHALFKAGGVPIEVRRWPAISALLDDALALPAAQRIAWLQALPDDADRVTLRRLLADHAKVETADFLNTFPRLALADEVDDSPQSQERSVGPYRLLRELGRGGMGTVWLADRSDGVLKRSVALKLPHPALAGGAFAERLVRERDILAALSHPHIAALYDAGVTPQGQPYMALAYFKGRTLIDHCADKALGVRDSVVLFMQVVQAVQYAHAHLVIHRDLKPSNVLVDEEGQVQLLDFGIAKLLVGGQAEATDLTLDAGRALTPDYASPEQIAGNPISIASDIYSLGVLLYEVLARQRPYRLPRMDQNALLQALLDVDVPAPSAALMKAASAVASSEQRQRAQALRGDLDTIVLTALKKRPDERYATAQALHGDLQRHLNGEPLLAIPDSAAYRLGKFVARHWLAVSGGALVLTALSLATGFSLWQAGIARQQARTAEAALGFLEDIFKANSANQPDPAKARQTSARELLDLGSQRVDARLADAPVARLRMLGTLAQMYDDLDLRPQVAELKRKRAEVARASYGADAPELADALVELASAAADADQPELAERSVAEAAAILDRRGDSTSMSRARVELEIGGRINNHGKLADALQHIDRSIQLLRRFPVGEELVSALNDRGEIELKLGHAAAARDAVAEAIQLATQLPGGLKNRMQYLLGTMASIQAELGDDAGAEASLLLALKTARENSGAVSPGALTAISELGYLQVANAHYREAVQRLSEAARLADSLSRAGNTGSSAQPIAYRRLAAALRLFGQPESALDALRTSRELWQGHAGVDEEALLLAATAAAEIDLGHFDKAADAIARRVELLRQRASGRVGRTNESVREQVALLLAQGQAAQAAAAFKEFSSDARATRGSRLALTHDLLEAEIDLANRDAAGAQALSSAALSDLAGSAARSRLRDLEAWADWLQGQALRAAGQPALALPLLQRALALRAEVYDAQHSPRLTLAQIALADCELDLGHRPQAAALLDQARTVQATHEDLGPQYREPLRRLEVRLARAP